MHSCTLLQPDCSHSASTVLTCCAAAFILAPWPACSKHGMLSDMQGLQQRGARVRLQLQQSSPRARVPCACAGTGMIAEDFVEALSLVPGAQLAAVAARSAERVSAARKFADMHGERPLRCLSGCAVCASRTVPPLWSMSAAELLRAKVPFHSTVRPGWTRTRLHEAHNLLQTCRQAGGSGLG